MPRIARKKSKSGIYHVILRGSNRQEIYHDDNDRIRFLETMDKYCQKSKIKLHGWCLMGNHVHLLIEEGDEELAITMKRIGVSYVRYFNLKYGITGHLFQDRYRSENVDSNEYLLTVIRYIHQNPVKAGIVKKCMEWKWSSCAGYYGKSYYPEGLLVSELILGMFNSSKIEAFELFKEYNESKNNDNCLEDKPNTRLSDEEAKEEIRKLKLGYDISEIRVLPKVKRNEIIKKIIEIEGLTQRQSARILGISPNLVFKA